MYNFSQQSLHESITQIIIFNDIIRAHDTRNRRKPHITQRRISVLANSLSHKMSSNLVLDTKNN